MFLMLATSRSFSFLYQTSIDLVLQFLTLTLLYLVFVSNKKDREFLLNVYKLVFPSAIILIFVLFSYSDNLNKTKIDYFKTKIRYDQITKENSLKEYEDYIESYLNKNIKTKNSLEEILLGNPENKKRIKKEEKEEKETTYDFILNSCASFLSILILFAFLWCLKELSIYKKLNYNILKNKKKKTNSTLTKINKQS